MVELHSKNEHKEQLRKEIKELEEEIFNSTSYDNWSAGRVFNTEICREGLVKKAPKTPDINY